MREIKFRAYSIKYKEYISIGFSILGETTCFNLIELWYIENKGVKSGLLDLVLHDVIIEQFTGLTDNNGMGNICLYEGDILSLDGKLIGNIHENKALLEERSNIIISSIGTKDWRNTEEKALGVGWGYAI